MDDFRRAVRAALEAEWSRQPAPDLGARAVDHAIRVGRRQRSQRLTRVVATLVAVVLALAAVGTLTYLGRYAHRSVPAGPPAPSPAPATPAATPSGTPTPSATPSPSPAGPPAFAVLNQPPQGGTATVSIADSTGRTLASAPFVPAALPTLGYAEPILQSPVRVAAGAVFYADAHGVVRRLGRDGSVTTIATFPLTNSQQELSFAVSPDGGRLMASVLTAPPVHVPPPANPGDPVFADNGHWSLELFTADAGQPAVSTYQHDLGTQIPAPTVIVGWDGGGPLATLGTLVASQQPPGSLRFAGTRLVHLGPDGTHLDQVAGGCIPLDEVADGTMLCRAGATFPFRYEIRRSSGELVWQQPAPDVLAFPYLSPDTAHVVAENSVLGSDGSAVTIGPAVTPDPRSGISTGEFRAQGWLDDHTVVGAQIQANGSAGKLCLIDLGNPTQVRQLPLDGSFVALL